MEENRRQTRHTLDRESTRACVALHTRFSFELCKRSERKRRKRKRANSAAAPSVSGTLSRLWKKETRWTYSYTVCYAWGRGRGGKGDACRVRVHLTSAASTKICITRNKSRAHARRSAISFTADSCARSPLSVSLGSGYLCTYIGELPGIARGVRF